MCPIEHVFNHANRLGLTFQRETNKVSIYDYLVIRNFTFKYEIDGSSVDESPSSLLLVSHPVSLLML